MLSLSTPNPLVEAKRTRQRARDLRHFERMGEPGAEMVAFVENKHLSLVGQPAKRRRMNNAIAVTAESIAREARCFRPKPAAAPPGV